MPQMLNPLRVIVLEEQLGDVEIVMNELSRLGMECFFRRLNNKIDLEQALNLNQWDIVISDNKISDLGIKEIVKMVKNFSSVLPVILFTQNVDQEEVIKLVKDGLDELVLKQRPEHLVKAIKSCLMERELKVKELEDRKLAKEALAAKEQMLAVVSHDIKNPLFAIQLEAQMLQRAAQKDNPKEIAEKVKNQTARILRTTERMKELIIDLLDKNKNENNLAKIVRVDADIKKIALEVISDFEPLAREKDVDLILRTSHPGMKAEIDRNKIFQVLSNLINNAMKFSPPHGKILIELDESPSDFIIKISDEGVGLNEQDIDKIFNKYWSGDNKACGTGLGLYICKTIIEAHGGTITAENRLRGGACFGVTIPKVVGMKASTRQKVSEKNNEQKRICLIDDDEDLRDVISWALGNEGYTVYSFQKPDEALGFLSHQRCRSELILLNFKMDEMNGHEFLKEKSKIQHIKNCPVLMISASPQEARRVIPADEYKEVITKPIDLDGLVTTVKRYTL